MKNDSSLIVDDDATATQSGQNPSRKTGNYVVLEENDPDKRHQSARILSAEC